MKENREALSTPAKVGLAAFGLAAVGIAFGFFGWYAVGSKPLARLGFFLTVAGVVLGFIAIAVGQVIYGRQAITGSVKAMKDLKQKLK